MLDEIRFYHNTTYQFLFDLQFYLERRCFANIRTFHENIRIFIRENLYEYARYMKLSDISLTLQWHTINVMISIKLETKNVYR